MSNDNGKVESVSIWRGRVSQQLDDMHDDIKDLKKDYISANKRMVICRRDMDKRVHCLEKKIYYILGGVVTIGFILTLLARIFF